ncbi:MAG: hypothetical protein IJA67_03325 [Oscillospiraceae bacterium]|nr:hypothetical protein [Oscillospiraceae bacterium]
MKQFIILMGNYGSGKTELAMEFALASSNPAKTLLIDLDMVNTYFRLSDRKSLFEEAGIRLITPNFASSHVEMLTVPAEIAAAFAMDWERVIIDLGGDAGAAALGQYKPKLLQAQRDGADIRLYNVINTNRPMAGTPQKLIRLMRDMERKARWSCTGLINNTNMSYETTAADLESGYEIIRKAAEETGLPVVHTSGTREVLDAFLQTDHDPKFVGEPLYLNKRMHRDWETLTKKGV